MHTVVAHITVLDVGVVAGAFALGLLAGASLARGRLLRTGHRRHG